MTKETKEPTVVRCTTSFSGEREGTSATVVASALYFASDPVVELFPEMFEPLEADAD